jgi:cysteine-rich secretory family protein
MSRRSASTLLAAALVFGGIALTPARAFASTQESRFTSLLNHERTSRGGHALVTKSDLVEVARRHSRDMAERGYIYHNSNLPNEVGGDWRILGENVGRGGSVDSIHNAFMNSETHKRNILDSRFNQIGVGTFVASNGYLYVTEVFAGRGSSPAPRRVVHRSAPRRVAPARAAVKPVSRPKARPVAPATIDAQSVRILVRLIGLDARAVNPATGAAMGL